MIVWRKLFSIAILLSVALNGCGDSSSGDGQRPIRIEIDFNNVSSEWQGGYSDYTPGTEPSEFVAEARPLPSPYVGNGFYTLGGNRSDDLFVYIKSQFAGFSPHTRYRVSFQVSFITNTPHGCVGVGGGPDSVTVKAGASIIEPVTAWTGMGYEMNIDKGIQSTGGNDALALGDIGNSSTDCYNLHYESKTLTSTTPLEITTDASGVLWLLFGMDSGFEASSHIYYQAISVTASPI